MKTQQPPTSVADQGLFSCNRIYLIGFMGAGKSTVAQILSAKRGFSYLDLDDEIEKSEGESIAEIFEKRGEKAFRALETEALTRTALQDKVVVATGGGIVLADENRALLSQLGPTVYLDVSAPEAIARIGDVTSRPLLAGPSAVLAATSLLKARGSLYKAIATITIDTVDKTPQEIAEEIEESMYGDS